CYTAISCFYKAKLITIRVICNAIICAQIKPTQDDKRFLQNVMGRNEAIPSPCIFALLCYEIAALRSQ
ncbi:hypothetical protein, partial [Mucilaginibacter dorajii]|uniref:hypothetical protein n=1 Tax=Mucilaginibacter dorajii TaxID=692994 RepID=UPI0031CFEE67